MTPDEAAHERMAAAIFDGVWEAVGRIWPRWTDLQAPDAAKDEARVAARAAFAALIADPPPAVERAVLERLIVRAADWPAYLWTDKGQHKGEGAREFLHERLAELAREESDGGH